MGVSREAVADPDRNLVVTYRRLEADDVRAAAAQHRRAFPDYFLGHMGQHFLELFYAQFVDSPGHYGFVALADGRVVGTVIGSVDLPRLFHDFYRRHFGSLAAIVAVRVIRDGYVRRHLLARLAHIAKAIKSRLGRAAAAAPDPSAWPPSQLLSIGVDEKFRGMGIGEALTEHFCMALADDAMDAVGLSVRPDNAAAIAFYLRTGWIRMSTAPDSATFWRRLEPTQDSAVISQGGMPS